jgi:molecular chaperone GrpE (heat shock protein)
MQKIDSRMIAVIALIIGLLAGYYVDNTILNKPRIESLTQTISDQNTTINNLENQLQSLQNDHDSLQTDYDQLYTESQQQIGEIENTVTQHQNQIDSLLGSVDTLETIINDKNMEVIELEEQLNTLQRKFDQVNNPLFAAFTLDDLNINITVTEDSYRDNSPIIGSVTITYTNGTSFTGSFKLTLMKVYPNIGTPSDFYNIQGSKIYSWENPFVLGAGSYRLNLSEIKDPLGNTVLTNVQLKPYGVNLFLG